MEVGVTTVGWAIGSETSISMDGEVWSTHKARSWEKAWEIWVLDGLWMQ